MLCGLATSMVTELLTVDAFSSKSVDLPRLAQFAAGSSIAGPAPFVMHRRLLLLLALPPGGEIARAMEKRNDEHPRLPDLVLKAILVDEDFANGRVV